ncbi:MULTISPECIES: TIM barrel protein [Bacillus cereus group]|uniref:Xylose isomerase n=1 Tax=Bacillus bombysepticus str. Wang TaxID=1330043 RepID=A0A9W3LP85_9BACI|nr:MULTISPECIES: TIM barrel protein [Bacillus cereus group]AHX21658.1 xylose isomerase [Bacillus bombysepticus str. Wang]MCE9758249.1 TIM barrel protein [Bacillus cereus]HDR7992363.1 TIM barrel protein [Bacillus cereus]
MNFSICFGAYPNKDVEYHLEKVKEHNLDGLEYYRWWNLDLKEVEKTISKLSVGLNSICTYYISLVDELEREEYKKGLEKTLEAAKKLGVKSIISQTGSYLSGVPRDHQRNTMIETLKQCAPLCEKAEIVLELEPLNSLVDHNGYYLQSSKEAVEIIEAVNSPNIKMCFDIYHQQISEGNIINNATQYVNHINHYHVADNPGRTEPGLGEINYVNVFKAIKKTKFEGFIGLECKYTKNTDECIADFKKNYIHGIFEQMI